MSNPLIYSWLSLRNIELSGWMSCCFCHRSLHTTKMDSRCVVSTKLVYFPEIDEAVTDSELDVRDMKLPLTKKKQPPEKLHDYDALRLTHTHWKWMCIKICCLFFTLYAKLLECNYAGLLVSTNKKIFGIELLLHDIVVLKFCCEHVPCRMLIPRVLGAHERNTWASVILIERKTLCKCWCLENTNRIY